MERRIQVSWEKRTKFDRNGLSETKYEIHSSDSIANGLRIDEENA